MWHSSLPPTPALFRSPDAQICLPVHVMSLALDQNKTDSVKINEFLEKKCQLRDEINPAVVELTVTADNAAVCAAIKGTYKPRWIKIGVGNHVLYCDGSAPHLLHDVGVWLSVRPPRGNVITETRVRERHTPSRGRGMDALLSC